MRERSDWLLAALAAAGTHGLTPVQLQKSLFLLGERRRAAVGSPFYDFAAYDYGPFSRAVYEDADRLSVQGLLEVDASIGRRVRTYRITPAGVAREAATRPSLDPAGLEYVARVVSWSQSLTFEQLVKAVYEAFPEMKANSVFRDTA